MFATPRYVIKGGRVIVEEGELREAPAGAPPARGAGSRRGDRAHPASRCSSEHYSVQFANYPVREPWLLEPAR